LGCERNVFNHKGVFKKIDNSVEFPLTVKYFNRFTRWVFLCPPHSLSLSLSEEREKEKKEKRAEATLS